MNCPVLQLRDAKQERCWADVKEAGVISLITQANLALVLTAVHQLGMAERLFSSPEEGLARNELIGGLDSYLGNQLIKYLVVLGCLEEYSENVRPTASSRAMFAPVAGAQLGFYMETYAPIVMQIPAFMKHAKMYGRDTSRDGRSLGVHCATLFKEFHTPTVLEALRDTNAKRILDLGCGAGQFLIDACERNPELTGVGLDIAEGAIAEANRVARARGLQDRLTFIVGDAFKPETWPSFCQDADAICAVGVVHEHFRDGEAAVINILNTYGSLLRKNGSSFILGEPEIRYDVQENDPDLFLIHIFTAQGFPRYREEWLQVIEKTELRCQRVYTRPAAGPRFNFFVLNQEETD